MNKTNKQRASYAMLAAGYFETSPPMCLNGGRMYEYEGTHYVDITDRVEHKVRRFLIKGGHPHSIANVNNVVACVKSSLDSKINKPTSMPFFAGDEHKAANLIAYNNGLLDVTTMKMMEHTQRWVSTTVLPYDYDPEATCPEWLRFLDEIFEGDEQRIMLLSEWFGYCLTGDTSHQKMLIQVGLPRAGKGTCSTILRQLIGEDNTTAFDLNSLSRPFGLRGLVGKQVAFVGEVELSREKAMILSSLKSITGGDPVQVEYKGLNITPTITLPTRFNISCNAVPVLFDNSNALAARLLILAFNQTFVGREDRELGTKLSKELSGINNWSLSGLKRLKQNGGFTTSTIGEERLTDIRRDSSPTLAFVQDCCRVERSKCPYDGIAVVDEPVSCTADQLKEEFVKWASLNGCHKTGDRMLYELNNLLPKIKQSRGRENGHRVRRYLGIDCPTCFGGTGHLGTTDMVKI